jgi:streptogramin lyase
MSASGVLDRGAALHRVVDPSVGEPRISVLLRSVSWLLAASFASCANGSIVPSAVGNRTFASFERDDALLPWTVFVPQGTSGIYNGITWGPQHQIWVADYGSEATPGGIVKMDVAGNYAEYYFAGLNPVEIAAGRDGDLYFDVGKDADQIAQMTPDGALSLFTIPSHDCICGNGMTRGRDGNVWFAETNHVGSISPAGTITEYGNVAPGYGVGVAYGPDKRVWGTTGSTSVYALTPSTGSAQTYALPAACYSLSIVAGSGNVLWFSCQGDPHRIGKITTAGVVTTYDIGQWVLTAPPHDMLVATDGSVWFAAQATIRGQLVNALRRFDPATDTFETHVAPNTHENFSWDIVEDASQNIWVSTHANQIDVLHT